MVSNSKTVKSAETLFEIIAFLQENEGATVTETANGLNLAKSSVHAHLMTLYENEYVVKEDSEYRLSLKFLNHGIFTRNKLGMLPIVRPKLAGLAEETGEVAWFITEEHGQIVNIYNVMGEHAVQTRSGIGERLPMHSTSGGKAVLAHLPNERRERVLSVDTLTEYTQRTVTDPEVLREQLETVREEGVAYSDGEFVDGVRAICSPILQEDRVVGGITISGPTNRLQGELYTETIPNLILGATNEIELKLLYSNTTRNVVGF